MEIDIGNILYIVITLVAVIIGLLGKKKKPGRQGTGEGVTGTQPGFMENLERMLSGEQVSPAVSEVQEFEEDLPHEVEPDPGYTFQQEPETRAGSSIMDDYERIMRSNDQEDQETVLSVNEDLEAPMELIDLNDDPGVNYFEVMDGFDARTAIVYSAIINRIDY